MSGTLGNTFRAAREAIERHGGGWSGLRSVIGRSYKVACALGLQGLLRRVRGAAIRTSPPSAPSPDISFPAPAPLEAVTLKVGVMAHVFYPDLIEEFAAYLRNIPTPFVLMVSVMDEQAKLLAEDHFARIDRILEMHVRIVPNRGRDIAPMLVTFHEEVLALDILCHIHTKKSLYTGSEQDEWRRYLLHSLLGSPERVARILGLFQAMPELGMVYPESFRTVPLIAHTWLSNLDDARELGTRLGIAIEPNAYLDFAAGTMFWARVDSIRPVYELGLTTAEFPEETGQKDGTLQHAIERVFAQIVTQRGMLLGVLPADGEFSPTTEGGRNWHTYFDVPIQDQIVGRSVDADVISFDIFDTLVVRPFLTPEGSRAYLEHCVRQRFGLAGFATLRQRAEQLARTRQGSDVPLPTIYRVLSRFPETHGVDLTSVRQMEIDLERRQLRARLELCSSVSRLTEGGKSVIGVSDMYLDERTLRDLLPPNATTGVQRIYVSCETGWRKDTGETWNKLPAALGKHHDAWLHVGDNEHSDKQLPHDLGFIPPAHVLRPSALLEVVPALRPLRPTREQAALWSNQLWLGLIANRFSSLADRTPHAFSDTVRLEDPATLGYVTFGPLVMDYLIWSMRSAREQGINRILFLSREGYLLHEAFKVLQAHVGAFSSLDGIYLLASRRAIGVATLQSIEDVEHLLGGRFTGTLGQLLKARMGEAIASATGNALGERITQTEVFLPEMRAAVIDLLRPAAEVILEIARTERDAYLAYWSNQAGKSRIMLSDVGYAGTIQTHLARLTGQKLSGAYFALNVQAEQTRLNGGEAHARFHDERANSDNASAVLRHDLLLESVLTAPTPQFSHFERNGEQLVPHYANDKDQLQRFAAVAEVHEGVKSFIEDACAVVGEDALHMEFDPNLVQQPLHCLGSGLWRTGQWGRDLIVDDHYTGRGTVAVGHTSSA